MDAYEMKMFINGRLSMTGEMTTEQAEAGIDGMTKDDPHPQIFVPDQETLVFRFADGAEVHLTKKSQ